MAGKTNSIGLPYVTLTASNLVVTDSSSNLLSTNTLSSTVLGNITKVTITKLTSGSGTYTAPANCTHITVRMWGAGGGGGGVAGVTGSGGAAGGGASGGYIESTITSPTSYSYSIGTGGAGGVAGANTGSAGGSTTFSTFTAGGGNGGIGQTSGVVASVVLGGLGAVNSGSPDLSFVGNAGFPGVTISSTVAISGQGALAPCSGGAPSGRSAGGAGPGAHSIGAGGAGATSLNSTSFAGGNGFDGMIIVQEYYNG
jgi:hypothetical protein